MSTDVNLRDYDRMPTIGAAMTPFPRSVSSDEPITELEQLMRGLEIRHLPVQEEGTIVGIVSARDLDRLVNPSLPVVDRKRIRARDVMTRNVYCVEIGTPLFDALQVMAERRIGSAVVLKHGRLVGIFSTTDACRILAHVLEERFPPGGDEAA